MQRDERAAKARELAEWFRDVARDDAGGLMDQIASLLEREAADQPQHAVPDSGQAAFDTHSAGPRSVANDNAKTMRRRTK